MRLRRWRLASWGQTDQSGDRETEEIHVIIRNSRAPLDDSSQMLKMRRLDIVISHQELTEPGTIRTIKLLKDRDNIHRATPREFELAEADSGGSAC